MIDQLFLLALKLASNIRKFDSYSFLVPEQCKLMLIIKTKSDLNNYRHNNSVAVILVLYSLIQSVNVLFFFHTTCRMLHAIIILLEVKKQSG